MLGAAGPSADPACWHDPDAAYDPSAPCQSPPVVEAVPAEPAVQPASYEPAATAIGRFDALPAPSGMTPPPQPAPAPIIRATYARPMPVRTASPDGGWAIQVGAFGRPEEASFAVTMAQRAAPAALAASRNLVTTTSGLGGHPLYRARLAGLDRDGAAAACSTLRGQSMPCMIVAPGS